MASDPSPQSFTQGVPQSGAQYALTSGGYSAEIASIGASLRSLRFRERDLVASFEADAVRPVYRGAVLAPWPNRVIDGSYEWNGEIRQLALTEPDRGHALHGLVCWSDFEPIEQRDDAVTLQTEIVPQAGYPHRVAVRVEYRLSAAGLSTTITGTNLSQTAAPWGTSIHPYLVAGPSPLNTWTLQLAASEVQDVTADRLIPTGIKDVADLDVDFRNGAIIGAREIDHAFTSVSFDDGSSTVTLTDPEGSGVAMTFADGLPWVQIHTADRPDPAEHRVGLAVEPMTCPPAAFNSGTDVIRLEPGQSSGAEWTIHAT